MKEYNIVNIISKSMQVLVAGTSDDTFVAGKDCGNIRLADKPNMQFGVTTNYSKIDPSITCLDSTTLFRVIPDGFGYRLIPLIDELTDIPKINIGTFDIKVGDKTLAISVDAGDYVIKKSGSYRCTDSKTGRLHTRIRPFKSPLDDQWYLFTDQLQYIEAGVIHNINIARYGQGEVVYSVRYIEDPSNPSIFNYKVLTVNGEDLDIVYKRGVPVQINGASYVCGSGTAIVPAFVRHTDLEYNYTDYNLSASFKDKGLGECFIYYSLLTQN